MFTYFDMSSYSGHQNHVLQCIKLRQTRYVSWNGKLNQDMYHHHNSALHEQLIYSKLQNLGMYRITCIMMTVSWYILFSCTPTDKLVMQGAWPGIVLMVFLHTSQRSYRKLTVSSLHHTLRPCYLFLSSPFVEDLRSYITASIFIVTNL